MGTDQSVLEFNPFLVWEDAHYAENGKWVYGKWKNIIPEIQERWRHSNSVAMKEFIGSLGQEGIELRKVSVLEQIQELETVIRQQSERYLNLVERDGKDFADIFLELWETKEKEKQLKKLQNEFLLKWADKTSISEEQILQAKQYPFHHLVKINSRGFTNCPFHQDKSPSFYVKNNFGHCFSCKKTCDTIQFVIETEHLDFISAVKKLCQI